MKRNYIYEKLKYGLFVHYIASYANDSEMVRAETLDKAAEDFDVEGFAEDVRKMGVEYVIFTAWHALAQPLYPSAVTEKWRPGNSVKRDLIGEVVDALNKIGVHVVLYTHPRDGHDFDSKNRELTGWGEGHDTICQDNHHTDTPNFDNFIYEKWNAYTTELYAELMERYGDRIEGIWLDGMGPGHFMYGSLGCQAYKYPIVSYLDIRRIIKSKNPDIAIIQNMTGDPYNTDFIMPEMYYGMERNIPIAEWPACVKALAICPFCGYTPGRKKGSGSAISMKPDELLPFLILQSTCSPAGGSCLAASPYRKGGWEDDVLETMTFYGEALHGLGESLLGTVPSTSWNTVSGDSLNSKNYVCACSSADRTREFIHILRMPEDGKITLPTPTDGAKMLRPRLTHGNARLISWNFGENGLEMTFEGGKEDYDVVVCFTRENDPDAESIEWVNDNDHRVVYNGDWKYYCYCGDKQWCKGYYEYDEHATTNDGEWLQLAFEGDAIEIVGGKGPNRGTADILIDGMKIASVDEYDETPSERNILYRCGNQYGGWHTLKIVKTGGQSFSFDAARIIRYSK